MKSLGLLLCLIGISAGFTFGSRIPPGLLRHLRTIDDYPRIAHLPPVRRRFENWLNIWRLDHRECGLQAIKPYNPYFNIVGGEEARPGSWPWMISLRFNPIHMELCAASLIDKEWLVTAAHCFKKDWSHPSSWTVQLGKYDVSLGAVDELEIERRIGKLFIHPKVNKGAHFNNDIALIKLDEPVEFSEYITPICLPNKGVHVESGTQCVVTGWGPEHPSPPSRLRQTTVPLISSRECRKLPHFSDITANMVCAGYRDGGADACNFDSGGPIQCQMGTMWILRGIISFGYNNTCGHPATPGVYTDVTKYLDWIYWHIFLEPFF